MRAQRIAILLLLGVLAWGTGCSRKADSRANNSANAGRPPVAVETATASLGEITESVGVVGTLAPKFEVEVRTEQSGRVAEVYVTEWVRVRQGMPLAKLDSREEEAEVAEARAARMQAEAAAQRAEREYERSVKLRSAGLATQQNLDDARSAREAAQAALDAARARLQVVETRLAKVIICAPMNGVVSHRGVNVGDYVQNMGSPPPMFRIVDNRLLDLTMTVPSSKLAVLRVGQPLRFETDAFPGRVFHGKVRFINPAAEEVSRSVKLIAEVPNPDEELKAGLFVKGQIITGHRKDVLQVPRAALLSWDLESKEAVLYVLDGQVARRRTVKTGTTNGDLVEITSGLAAGETVVTRGAFNLRDGARVQVISTQGA